MISPLYGQLSPLRVPTSMRRVSDDNDANAYLLAVESADGQELESGVITAVESFITGCKSDGIWSALKASCILAGARTLSGALVPLVGSAPTNLNFVSGDYDRKTGLLGNGSTKCLNTNRADNADPQDSHHFSLFAATLVTTGRTYGGLFTTPQTNINTFSGATNARCRNNSTLSCGTIAVGFKGVARETNLLVKARNNSTNYQNANLASSSPSTANKGIFSRTFPAESTASANCRISFYSIGESLDLAKLDTRVSTLMTALAAAIP
jgi:hypothetical protein